MEKRPISREKKIVGGTGRIGRQGAGLGTEPVGNRGGNTGLGTKGVVPKKGSVKKDKPGSAF